MEVARVLGVKRGTAWSIVSRFLANGVVARPRGGRRITKIDAEMIETCIQIVEDHAEYTLSQINAELRRRNPNKPIVCDSSISKMLHGKFIKLKNWKRSRQREIEQTSKSSAESLQSGSTMPGMIMITN